MDRISLSSTTTLCMKHDEYARSPTLSHSLPLIYHHNICNSSNPLLYHMPYSHFLFLLLNPSTAKPSIDLSCPYPFPHYACPVSLPSKGSANSSSGPDQWFADRQKATFYSSQLSRCLSPASFDPTRLLTRNSASSSHSIHSPTCHNCRLVSSISYTSRRFSRFIAKLVSQFS